MDLYPCLRVGPQRWWLPLWPATAELLGHVLLSTGQTERVGLPDRLREQLARRLREDPTLFLFAALAPTTDAAAGDASQQTPGGPLDDLERLADRLAADATERFAEGDAFLGAPRLSETQRRRWRELHDYFRTLPVRRWIEEAPLWLEVAGPSVPDTWRGRWPQLDPGTWKEQSSGTEGPSGGETVSAAGGLLARLARQTKHSRALQRAFDENLRQAKLAAVRQLAYGLSHEINNPLANISTRAQQLLRDESDPSRAAMLQRIVDQVYRAHEMITDLMFFANPPAPRMAPFALRPVASEVAQSLRPEAERHAIRLEIDGGGDLVETRGDADMIGEAVRVLVRNAIEAVGTEGTVVVRVSREGGRARVDVADSGPGLSAEAREHAFDPYYSGREAGRGLGLGLCRAYRIAELHGAELTLSGGPAGCVASLVMPGEPNGRPGDGGSAPRDAEAAGPSS